MTDTAGYSGTPLPRKLGFKPGQSVAFINLPEALTTLRHSEDFGETLDGVEGRSGLDLIHAFYIWAADFYAALPALRAAIRPAGVIWISWPKKAAKVPTDLTEDVIRAEALRSGLVDVKVCAVSDVWSGLKLVIPVALRRAAV